MHNDLLHEGHLTNMMIYFLFIFYEQLYILLDKIHWAIRIIDGHIYLYGLVIGY